MYTENQNSYQSYPHKKISNPRDKLGDLHERLK